jgi:hypothetical protein
MPYRVWWKVRLEVVRDLGLCGFNDIEQFLKQEYGLVETGLENLDALTEDYEYEYAVSDEKLLTLFLLRWA